MENSDVKIINPKTLILTDTDFYLTGQGIFLKSVMIRMKMTLL